LVLKATGGRSESCTLLVAARAEGCWKGEEEGEKGEEEMPMAAAVTASRPRRKAPLRVVD